MWLRLALVETLLVLTAMGAPDTSSEEPARAAPFLVVVGESPLRCVGALVSVRGVLTTRECGAVALEVRSPGSGSGSGATAVAVRAVRAPRSGDVALLELEEPVAGRRPILLAEEQTQCSTSCYVAREKRPAVVAAVPVTCEGGADTGCVRAEGLCGAEAGGAVVCGGRLCGVLARTDTDCPELHRFYSVPNWKQFLHCAHTLNTCASEECSEICEETAAGQAGRGAELSSSDVGAGEVVVRRARGKYESGREYRAITKEEPTPDKEEAAPEKEEPAPDKEEPAPDKEEHPAAEPEERSVEREERPVVVEVEPEVPVAKEEPSPVVAGAPRGVVFEPGRADFRSGEYGDTAVEYEDVEPRGPPASSPSPPGLPAPLTAPHTVHTSAGAPTQKHNKSLSLSRRAAEPPRSNITINKTTRDILRSNSHNTKYDKIFFIALLLTKMIFM